MTDSSQKRGTQRVDVTLKVQLQYPDRNTFVERFSINVSRTGVFVRARDPAPVGSRVRFEYRLNDESRVLRGTGVVRWARTDTSDPAIPPGMGIEFIDLDPQSEQLVTHIVATRGEGERAPKRAATPAVIRTRPVVPAKTASSSLTPQLDQEEEDLLAGLAEGGAPKRKTPEPTAAPAAIAKTPAKAQDEPTAALELDLDSAVLDELTRDDDLGIQVDIEEPVAESAEVASTVDPDAPHVIFDLAGPALLATLSMPNDGAPPDRFDERKLDLTLGMSQGALALGGTGVAVPGLFAWADKRETVATRVVAQKLGLTLRRDATARPCVDVDGTDVPLLDVALAAARHTLRAYAEQASIAPSFRVIVPASAESSLVDELGALFKAASSKLTIVDDLAVLGNRGSHGSVIVVTVTAIEARVGTVTHGVTQASIALRDCGLMDIDEAVAAATGRALMKEHGIDVDDDPSLRTTLAKQIELGRRAGSADFDVSIAGATVIVDNALTERAVYAIAARIALGIDELMGNDTSRTVLLATDDATWPSLATQLERLLGHEVEHLGSSPWIRLG